MTTVGLTTVWMNRASDLSDVQSFPTMSSLKVKKARPVRVARMPGGTFRTFVRSGTMLEVSVNLPGCDRTQVAWLEAHVGVLVCVRDDRGRKVYGVYQNVDADENRVTTAYANCAVSIDQITHIEGE